MNDHAKNKKAARARIFYVRLKQFATTFFVVVTTTLMIQNVWYPESFRAFKKSWRAGVGALIFLMGFAVARVLFDMYAEQVREIKKGARKPDKDNEASGQISEAGPPSDCAGEDAPGNIAHSGETTESSSEKSREELPEEPGKQSL